MGNSPFDFARGIAQWRIKPVNGKPYDGNYVWTLGYDGLVDRIEEFAYNDFIQISQAVNLTGVDYVTARVSMRQPKVMPNYRDISKNVQFISGSSGGGHRMVVPLGVDDSHVGRTVTISGAVNGGNNGDLKIVGIADPITAYVNKTLVTEGPRASITAIEKGARWKLSMLVDTNSGIVERARLIQESRESNFYRDDLKMNVAKLTGVRNIYFRFTLIEHNPNNIYTMP